MRPRALRDDRAVVRHRDGVAAPGARAAAAGGVEDARAVAAAAAEAADALAVDADRALAERLDQPARDDHHGAADAAGAAVTGIGSGPAAAATASRDSAKSFSPDAVGVLSMRFDVVRGDHPCRPALAAGPAIVGAVGRRAGAAAAAVAAFTQREDANALLTPRRNLPRTADHDPAAGATVAARFGVAREAGVAALPAIAAETVAEDSRGVAEVRGDVAVRADPDDAARRAGLSVSGAVVDIGVASVRATHAEARTDDAAGPKEKERVDRDRTGRRPRSDGNRQTAGVSILDAPTKERLELDRATQGIDVEGRKRRLSDDAVGLDAGTRLRATREAARRVLRSGIARDEYKEDRDRDREQKL